MGMQTLRAEARVQPPSILDAEESNVIDDAPHCHFMMIVLEIQLASVNNFAQHAYSLHKVYKA